MRILKKVLIVLGVLIAIPLILAAFTKKEYAVEKEVTINKSKQEVFDYIKSLKNQEKFSKWAAMDPDMERTYSGTDGTVGFVAGWKSDNPDVGVGEQEIISIKNGERIDFELRFMEPFEASDKAYMTTEDVGNNQTKVKWGFNGRMDYPMNFMMVFMDMEEMIGNDFAIGLENLKGNLE
ncbi:polyketide cyclase [Maribacter algarum]|uniref:Polyketide cyclase n=1 Tax=Maribacter algarum (ex Zhang et al. 2020) TaxID=2578118 RepID=A0A5S3PR26_9FLAO|nr:SRPBCC family protein [Maribacter algarum]TMM57196.1 polyketide cyclase [Maribacter algarum]